MRHPAKAPVGYLVYLYYGSGAKRILGIYTEDEAMELAHETVDAGELDIVRVEVRHSTDWDRRTLRYRREPLFVMAIRPMLS